jgi:hypothetical protein
MPQAGTQATTFAHLEVRDAGERFFCCGAPGCGEVLAKVSETPTRIVRRINRDGSIAGATRRAGESRVELVKGLELLNGTLWGNPNGPGVPPELRSRFIANRRAEKLRLREQRAERRVQLGGPVTERQFSGIRAGRVRGTFNREYFEKHSLFIICPSDGSMNEVRFLQ